MNMLRGFRSTGIRTVAMEEMLLPSIVYWGATLLALVLLLVLIWRVERRRTRAIPFFPRESRRFLLVRLAVLLALLVLAVSGVKDGSSPEMLKYYTYLSNILVCITVAVRVILCALRLFGLQVRMPGSVCGWVALSIFFTFATVFLVLSPFSALGDWLDARIHYVVPLLTVADWVIFEPRGTLRWYHPLCWLFTPVVYFAYVLALVQLGIRFKGSQFPYFFMNVQTLGWGKVLTILVMLAAVFLAVGYAMVAFDRRKDLAAYIRRKKNR